MFVLTTYSPLVVADLPARCIRVLERDGFAVVMRPLEKSLRGMRAESLVEYAVEHHRPTGRCTDWKDVTPASQSAVEHGRERLPLGERADCERRQRLRIRRWCQSGAWASLADEGSSLPVSCVQVATRRSFLAIHKPGRLASAGRGVIPQSLATMSNSSSALIGLRR
jgi:hypothetical protein